MMTLPALLSPNALKLGVSTGASTGALAAVQSAANGTIEVSQALYSWIAVVLGLLGVYLARLVTIGDENKRLGRTQTYRETGPLTLIGVLIVCPFIWHFNIAIPWASMIGLGVGYSVKLVLKIFGNGAVDAARALARRAATALDPDGQPEPTPAVPAMDAPGARPPAVLLPATNLPADQQALIDQLDDVPDVEPTGIGAARGEVYQAPASAALVDGRKHGNGNNGADPAV